MNDAAPISIRRYEAADKPAVHDLYVRTPPAGDPTALPQPWPDDLEHADEHYLALWVAVTHAGAMERVIAMAGALQPQADLPQPLAAMAAGAVQVRRMRVAPEWQRRGIGRRLTKAVIDWARDRGAAALILESTTGQQAALELYRSMGFQEVGRSMLGPYELVWFRFPLR